MDREEHLQWAKDRALEYCNQEDLNNAFASLMSDLRKHSELENHLGIQLGMMAMLAGTLNTQYKMKKFIDGFN